MHLSGKAKKHNHGFLGYTLIASLYGNLLVGSISVNMLLWGNGKLCGVVTIGYHKTLLSCSILSVIIIVLSVMVYNCK